MAGESCVYKPTVRNKQGEEVESRLFNSLLTAFNNDRGLAKQHYYVATNEEFLRENAGDILYDENGEITFSSYKKLVPLDVDGNKLIERLNKDLKAGTYDWNTAVSRVVEFNENSDFNDEYIATLSPSENGKATISVVKNTEAAQLTLEENIASNGLFERIKNAVQALGGSIDFIDEDYSVYDTQNAQRLESGLYGVISLSKNGNITDNAAHEAGHFAVGAMGNHPLVQRLQALCTPEVQQRIFGDRYESVSRRSNPVRETAGELVGRHIRGQVDQESAISRLVNRILDRLKQMFYVLTFQKVKAMRAEAESIAKEIARGFMATDIANFNINNALETQEVLYSVEESAPETVFKEVMQRLNDITKKMTNLDKTLHDKWKKLEEIGIGRLFSNPNQFARTQAIEGLTIALQQLTDAAPSIISTLDSVVTSNEEELIRNAKKLREVRIFTENVALILKLIDSLVYDVDILGDAQNRDQMHSALLSAYTSLSSLIMGPNKLDSNLRKKEKGLFLNFLRGIYGDDYIHRAARMVFVPVSPSSPSSKSKNVKEFLQKVWKEGINFEGFKLEKRQAEIISIDNLITILDKDDNMMNRWLASMADSSDIANQLAYKAKKVASKKADDLTLAIWDGIRVLREDFASRGINTDLLFERYSQRYLDEELKSGRPARRSSLTGNFISELNWGEWEEDFANFKRSHEEIFRETFDISSMTSAEKDMSWDLYFREHYIKWHKEHSTYDKNSQTNIPKKELYANKEWDNLSYDEQQAVREIIAFKESIDKLLEAPNKSGELIAATHTSKYRIPQFKGSTQNRIENLMETQSAGRALSGALRQNIMYAFCITGDDQDFGSVATHNTIDDDIFRDTSSFNKTRMRRIPLYGINKFKDMSELSTDIFANLLQYGAMASSFKYTSELVDMLEVGSNVLEHRDTLSGFTPRRRSNAYLRYMDFLDAQVYNIYQPTKWKLGKVVISKVIGFFNGLASRVFLGGNVAGGVVNALTGFTEITKEAIAGEVYNIGELKTANRIYFSHWPSMFSETGKDMKFNKVDLFMRRFQAQEDLNTDVRQWSTRETRLHRANPFGENVMLPYKSGDHYMQCMSYLAAAQHYKFINPSTNEEVTLWDVLQESYIDQEHPGAGKTLKIREGFLFKDTANGTTREWTSEDELKFRTMCRETNNRMHGIYNKMDKSAFHNQLLGQALLTMKGYALGMLYRRFSTNQHNIALSRESEGSMVSAAKLLVHGLSNKSDLAKSLRMLVLPWSKQDEQRMTDMGFSVSQYRNIRRNAADFGFIICEAILRGILKNLTAKDDDDDDDYNIFLGYSYYVVNRLLNEQAAFNWPTEMFREQKSLVNGLMPIGASLIWQVGDIMFKLLTWEKYDKEGGLFIEEEPKVIKSTISYIPWFRTYKIIKDPVQATKDYEFMRATKR